MPMAPASNGRINILCLDNALFVICMADGFFGYHKTGSHLHGFCSQHKGCRHAPAVSDSACGNNWDLHSVHHLGNQCHRSGRANVAAGFCAFCHQGVCAAPFHHPGQRHAGYHRDHLTACRFPLLHIFARVSCTCGDHRHLFFYQHLGHLVCIGA